MPNDIEVTPDMIAAGIEALAGSPESDGGSASDLVAAIYTAMEAARRAPQPKAA